MPAGPAVTGLKAWKTNLAKLATELGLEVTVCHYPPGTSKWNKIEHRMFSFITMNWRGRPLLSYRTIVELISATETKSLKVHAELDPGSMRRKSVSNAELDRYLSSPTAGTVNGITPSRQPLNRFRGEP